MNYWNSCLISSVSIIWWVVRQSLYTWVTLGRRSKWKAYVDLYFLLTEHFSIQEISAEATQLFGELFSEKMFRIQLTYFEDVDYSEEVEYLIETPPTDQQVKDKLTELATQF